MAIFRSLKIYWSQERDRYEWENGEIVMKENVLAIYAKAHIHALTPETIWSAFWKTRSWPYNPNVITMDMMAPSLKTTCQGSLPLVQATPICWDGNLRVHTNILLLYIYNQVFTLLEILNVSLKNSVVDLNTNRMTYCQRLGSWPPKSKRALGKKTLILQMACRSQTTDKYLKMLYKE